MKTVDKAMTVLDQFSFERTEIGLSDLARLAGLDKAATRRMLVALAKHDFIEQSPETKKYRLGHGFLRLARVREATVPLARAAQDVADWLGAQVNETIHVNVPYSEGMSVVAYRLPTRGNIINLNPAEPLPYHATSAGIAYLAAASEATRAQKLALPRKRLTVFTLTEAKDIEALIAKTQQAGFAQTQKSFDVTTASLAMAFHAGGSDPAGTISIALPDTAMTETRKEELLAALHEAIARIEQALTG